ncbi:hypothetical protein BV22DRAFT_1062546, partial [Leucogyrophana mollusca]
MASVKKKKITSDTMTDLQIDTQQLNVSSKAKLRGRKGGLALLPTMSLDILFEIFGALHPKDLLNLSRTSKTFRELLMQKSKAFLWRAARSQVPGDFPDCPPDLSEPQYARLAFDTYCYGCDKRVHKAIWQFRVRFCPKCQKDSQCMSRDRDLPSLGIQVPNNAILPAYRVGSSERYEEAFLRSQFDALSAQLEEVPSSDMDAFLENRRNATREVQEHAAMCEQWVTSISNARHEERAGHREKRMEAIRSWMVKEGWQPEVDYFGWHNISDHRSIKDPKPLTDKIWGNVRPLLIEHMSAMRNLRIELTVRSPRRNVLFDIWTAFLADPSLPSNISTDVLPHAIDVARFKPFDEIIKSPEGTVVNRDSFSAAFDELPELITAWRQSVDDKIVSALESAPEVPPVIDPLRLATSGFFCARRRCGAMLFHSDLVAHKCSVQYPDTPKKPSIQERIEWSVYDDFGARPWSLEFIAPRSYISQVEGLVRLCGLDPQTATIDDMDKLDAMFCCRINNGPFLIAMNWRTAMSSLKHGRQTAQFQLLEGEDYASAKDSK